MLYNKFFSIKHINSKSYQKEYRDNMSDEQKQKLKDYQKRYRDNMSDEQKQKLKDYQKKI